MPRLSVGDTAQASLKITDETINQYADLVGDRNPFHTDPEYAAESIFGGKFAHGMLIAGVISAAMTELPGENIYLAQDISFEHPVFPGDTVTATVTASEYLGDDRMEIDTVVKTESETIITGTAVQLMVREE
ncbi:MaoC family dehydratase [Natrononativus amylolyticus]|uniref:MaoC family dehydratase n=1 Tax=Natrononativus amylolyticus TaxID=2963434 RepID=UPI0020CC0AC5|nr:MaoC family dehydratase [Natrononativus amylolyticus]